MSEQDVAGQLHVVAEEVVACTRCDLHLTARRGVPGEGSPQTEIILVGEAPGRSEDEQGRPFVGAAGKFLDQLLAAAGLVRNQVFITNVVKHRPPENRPPERDELLACRPYLERQIEAINPRLIITLGRFSLETFFPPAGPGSGISRVHGQVRKKDGRYFFHSYHPAAALHRQELRQTLLDDMKTLGAFLRGPFAAERELPPEQTSVSAPAEPHQGEEPPQQLALF